MRKVSMVLSLVVLLVFCFGALSLLAQTEEILEPVVPVVQEPMVEEKPQWADYDIETLFRYIDGKRVPLLPFLSFQELVVEVVSKDELIEIGKLLSPLGFVWQKDLNLRELTKEDSSVSRFSLWKRPIELKDLTKEKYIKLIEEILGVLNKVRNSDEGINAYPVFNFPKGSQIPTGEFVVEFRTAVAGVSEADIQKSILESGAELEKSDLEKRIFLLKVGKDTPKNIFAMANSFHESILTISSYPVFKKVSLPVEVKVKVVPNGLTVREPFQYILEIEKDKEIILEETYLRKGSPNVEALRPEAINSQLWEIKEVEISKPESISKTREKMRVVYTILVSQPGEFTLPSLALFYKIKNWKGEVEIKKLESLNSAAVKVASFLPDVFDINDIKLPEKVKEFPGKLTPITLLIVELVALAVVIVALYRLNLAKPEPEEKKKEEASFYEVALEKLDEFKENADSLDFRDTEKRSRFFVKLLDLVKKTLEKKFHLNLTSISFEGLSEQLGKVGASSEIIELTQKLLEQGEREIYSPVSEFDKKDLDGILANIETLILAVTEEENDPSNEGEDNEAN